MPPIYIGGQEVVKRYVGISEVVAAYVGSQQVFSSGVSLSQIQALFGAGDQGGAWDLLAKSSLFQDSAGTTPVTTDADPIGRASDLSGKNNHLLQTTSGARPLYYPNGADFDGSNDYLETGTIAFGGTNKFTLIIGIKMDVAYASPPSAILAINVAGRACELSSGVGLAPYNSEFANSLYKQTEYSATVARVVTGQFDVTRSTPELENRLRIDGNYPALTAHGGPSETGDWWVTNNATISLGTSANRVGAFINAKVARAIVINRTLTVEELAIAESWVSENHSTVATGYSAGLNFFPIFGQSLAGGSAGGAILTTAQEYDNVMFPVKASSPASYAPAFATGVDSETPMYGALGHIKELIGESGADPVGVNYQLLTCNNGYGSYSIVALNKGNVPFSNLISQVAAGKSIATANGKTYKFRATMWLQGEADNAMSYATYKSEFRKLAADLDDMGRASSLQGDSPIIIAYQCTTNVLPAVALAQLDASIEDPLIYIACPKYPMEHAPDGLHWTAEGAKFGGGYFGLVYKKVVIDGGDWSPVRPLSYSKSGLDVTITMHVPVGPLALDTTLLPEQTNYGFAAFDSGGTPISITGVTLVGSDKVKITTASPIPSGGYITYAQSAQPDPARSLGGCGNLRDSQGASITYLGKPMHNWCVLFTQVIA